MSRGYQVYRGRKPVSPVYRDEVDAESWLLDNQGQSIDHALRYEGYTVEKVAI